MNAGSARSEDAWISPVAVLTSPTMNTTNRSPSDTLAVQHEVT